MNYFSVIVGLIGIVIIVILVLLLPAFIFMLLSNVVLGHFNLPQLDIGTSIAFILVLGLLADLVGGALRSKSD